jgi:hypothetical protein
MEVVVANCKKELDRFSEQMKKNGYQSRIEPPSFKPGNLVMLQGKYIKTRRPAQKLEHNMYRPLEILDILSPTAGRLHLTKTWKIYPVYHASVIESFVEGNWDVDINAILKTSDLIKNALEYNIDKVMGSTKKVGKVLYLVKRKGWLAKKHGTREPVESLYSVRAIQELRVFHSNNPNTSRDSHLTDSGSAFSHCIFLIHEESRL